MNYIIELHKQYLSEKELYKDFKEFLMLETNNEINLEDIKDFIPSVTLF